jgi:hypothetical protein
MWPAENYDIKHKNTHTVREKIQSRGIVWDGW